MKKKILVCISNTMVSLTQCVITPLTRSLLDLVHTMTLVSAVRAGILPLFDLKVLLSPSTQKSRKCPENSACLEIYRTLAPCLHSGNNLFNRRLQVSLLITWLGLPTGIGKPTASDMIKEILKIGFKKPSGSKHVKERVVHISLLRSTLK